MPSSYNPGGSSYALPVWTFGGVGTTPASGQFMADSTDPTLVNTLSFSPTAKFGDSVNLLNGASGETQIVLTLTNITTGVPYTFYFSGAPTGSDPIVFGSLSDPGGAIGPISGDYALDLAYTFNLNGFDGSVTPVTSITVVNGVVTDVS